MYSVIVQQFPSPVDIIIAVSLMWGGKVSY